MGFSTSGRGTGTCVKCRESSRWKSGRRFREYCEECYDDESASQRNRKIVEIIPTIIMRKPKMPLDSGDRGLMIRAIVAPRRKNGIRVTAAKMTIQMMEKGFSASSTKTTGLRKTGHN